jgi:hypothetical protein
MSFSPSSPSIKKFHVFYFPLKISTPYSFALDHHLLMLVRLSFLTVVTVIPFVARSVALECDLYFAESTIPNAGIGIFSGVAKAKGDTIGNGDKAIPLIDWYWNNGMYEEKGDDEDDPDFFNPLRDYVWVSVLARPQIMVRRPSTNQFIILTAFTIPRSFAHDTKAWSRYGYGIGDR